MSETERKDVLRRKARIGRAEHEARVMSPARALRIALARAAEDLFDLALAVSSVQAGQVGQDAAVGAFADDRLLVVLDGPGGAIGAASVDLAVLSGLIEMQTMGKVLPRQPEARMPTRTDAALVAPLVDAMLDGFEGNLAAQPEGAWAAGFRFGAMVESVRILSLLLEAPDFHLFRLDVDLGDGAKAGEVVIALPHVSPAARGAAAGSPAAAGAVAAPAPPVATLAQGALMNAEARLDAVLHRLRMPLSAIAALKPGDVLEIPREALTDTRLVAGTGHVAGKCRLGQINGNRAVRLLGRPAAAPRRGENEGHGLPGPEMQGRAAAQAEAAVVGPPERPETGTGMTGQPDRLRAEDMAVHDAAQAGAPGMEGAAGMPGAQESGPGPDAGGDPGGYGTAGDFADLPELALDDHRG